MEGNVKTNRFIREKAPKSDREVIKRNTDITRKKSRAILISGKKVSEIKTVRNFEASEIFTVQYKGSGKRGHIVANALLPTQMFPRLPARETFVADTNSVSGTQKVFLILFRNILCPQQMFPSLRSARNIMGNNVSATMCPRLPGP